MSTTINPYAARVQNILRQTTTALPKISFVDTSNTTGVLGTATPYIIYSLIAVFIIFLILVIIHYSYKPIFKFGPSSNVFLSSLGGSDWVASWNDPNVSYYDTRSKSEVPRADYSILLDFKVIKGVPSPSTKNEFILTYKTISQEPKKLTDFTFPLSSITTDPSLVITYNTLTSKINVYYLAQNKGDNAQKFTDMISADVVQGVGNRLALTVSDNIIEIYINGRYANSKVLTGKTLIAANNEVFFSAPAAFSENVIVKNLYITPRVVTSGEISSSGEPALK